MAEVDLGTRSIRPGELEVSEPTPSPEKEEVLVVDTPSTQNKGAEQGQESKVEYTARERQLYERTKKLEAELAQRTKPAVETPVDKGFNPSSVDPYSLAKTVATLKDYDATEIDYISTIAKVKNVSPEQAVQSPEVKLWLVGKRDQDYKNSKIPAPGGSGSSGHSSASSEAIEKMTPEQHKQYEREYLAKARNKGSGL